MVAGIDRLLNEIDQVLRESLAAPAGGPPAGRDA
jgi:hypothetical protein